MLDPRVIEWIKKQQSQGHSSKELFEYLTYKGYDAAELIELLAQPAPQKKSHAGTYIAVTIVFLLVIAAIAYYYFSLDRTVPVVEQNRTEEYVVESSCGDIVCFREAFSGCHEANMTSSLGTELRYTYIILGPKDGLCEVKSYFEKNPNPEWVGKDMTCLYDQSQEFDAAITDIGRCQGALYDMMIQN